MTIFASLRSRIFLTSALLAVLSIAVAIYLLDQMLELDIHVKISSHGSHTALSSSNISNASSSFLRSHTVRALILFGFGIRPSATIWSNREGDTPIYAAAWVLDNPRGAIV